MRKKNVLYGYFWLRINIYYFWQNLMPIYTLNVYVKVFYLTFDNLKTEVKTDFFFVLS